MLSKKKKPKSQSKSKKRTEKSVFSYLQTGDVIDIVAPGSPCSKEVFEHAVAWIKAQGYIPRYPQDMLAPEIFISNTDEKRLQFLVEALKNKESKAVWCLRGGYGAIRLVPQLLKIKKLPQKKLFIGYSDVTTIHLWLNQKMKWPTVHGPLLDRCGQNQLSENNKNELLSVLSGQKKEVYFSDLKPVNSAAKKHKTKLKAQLYGGNLTVVCSSLGTELQPAFKNHFLFFEDIGERGYRIDRMLNQLEQAGLFKSCKAVFLGDFILGQETNGDNHVWTVLQNFFEKLKCPVYSGVQSGHGEQQRPLILNGSATLTCDNSVRLLTSFE